VIGPIGGGPVTLSKFQGSELLFNNVNGQVLGNSFDNSSNVTLTGSSSVDFTDGRIPNLFCDGPLAGITIPPTVSALVLGSTVTCSISGFTMMRLNARGVISFGDVVIGGPNDFNSTFFISQDAHVIFNGMATAYANIYNLGIIDLSPGARLSMVDASIYNHGLFRFGQVFTFLDGGSNIYINESQFLSWFYNDGGEVESLGFPQISIKFNNTGGIMTAHVDSELSIAEITGAFSFTGPEVIFKQSKFQALDSVLIFDYNPWYPLGVTVDSTFIPGSFGLPFEPIITLPKPFDPIRNGYFSPDPYYIYSEDDFGLGYPSQVFVSYYYNNYQDSVPDGVETGSPYLPRLIVVTRDPFSQHNFTNSLTLVASTNTLIASPFFVLLFSTLSVLLYIF